MGHLGGLSGASPTSLVQGVSEDAGNSSTANIAIGGSFTGAWASTLGVAALQYTFVASQPCIVYVEQSTDGFSVDDQRQFYYNPLAGIGNANQCVLALGALWRVRVVNIGAGVATGVRLYSVLCPIAPPDPVALDPYGNKRSACYGQYDHYGDELRISPHGFADTSEPYRLVGTMFGTVAEGIGSLFWGTATNGSGAAAIATPGVVTLSTGVTNPSHAQIQTSRVGRYINLNAHRFYGRVDLPVVTVAGSSRFWGSFTSAGAPTLAPVDGYTFDVDAAGALNLSCWVGGSRVGRTVASGSFNGDVNQYVLNNNSHAYEIVWTVNKARFIVDGVLLHTFTGTTSPLSGTQHLPVTFLARGTGTNATLNAWSGSITRLGRNSTSPKWQHFAAANAGTALKRGPGSVHRVVFDSGANVAGLTLYDTYSAPAAGNMITNLGLAANVNPTTLEFGLDFYTGLWVVITGNTPDVTVIYE